MSVSLRIGCRSHWYVSTPYGELDYQSQGIALNGLVLYRLINKTDLEKMTELRYEPAKKELVSYEKTMTRACKITSEDLRAEEEEKEKQLAQLDHRLSLNGSSDDDKSILVQMSKLENQISGLPNRPLCHVYGKKIGDFSSLILYTHGAA